MDRFNRVFQKSTENTTCQLYTDMSRRVRLYAANVLERDAIAAAGENLQMLDLKTENQLLDRNLGIGSSTWACLAELEAEQDLKPFFRAVRAFYISTIQKMLQKFPFSDSLLKDLGILLPDKAASYSVDTILGLAKRFPQIGLSDPESLDRLKEQFLDFCLSPMDIPSPAEYSADYVYYISQIRTAESV